MPETEALDLSAFKHVVVPIGVIVGLGVARTMTSVSHYIQHRGRVRFAVGHAAWCAVLFLMLVGLWWIAWGFRTVDGGAWSFFTLIFLLLGPSFLFLAAALLVPDLPDEGALDLGDRLESMARPIFLCLIGFLSWLVCSEIWLKDEVWIVMPKRAIQATAISLFTIGAVFPSRRVATVLGILVLLVVIFALGTVRAQLA